MKSFQVIRLNVSSYQAPLFIQREKEALESLGLRYYTHHQELADSPLILLTNTHSELSLVPELINKTRLIVHPNSGYDNLSKNYDLIENIPTVIGHEIRSHAVAEWILGVFFNASLTIPHSPVWDASRQWNRTRLKDKEVVLFGYGHIGAMVFQSLESIGIKVQVIDPYKKDFHKHFSELEAKKYHALIVCCGLNEDNKRMFNKVLFDHLGFNLFINGARGGLVDEAHLKTYLVNNPDSYAYLDVFESEPYGNEWKDSHQVIRSSHIAGVFQELDQEIIHFETRILEDYLHLDESAFKKKHYTELLSSKFKEGVII